MQKVYNNQKWYLSPYFPQAFKCPCGRHEHPPSTLYPTLLSSALILPQTSLKNPACRPHERPYPHNNPTCNRQQYDKVPPASSALSLFILVPVQYRSCARTVQYRPTSTVCTLFTLFTWWVTGGRIGTVQYDQRVMVATMCFRIFTD